MCQLCERPENLMAGWDEDRDFQEQASRNDYHRGLFKGFSEYGKNLYEAVASKRLKGICKKLPEFILMHSAASRS